jgi:HK97 family phage portal protein
MGVWEFLTRPVGQAKKAEADGEKAWPLAGLQSRVAMLPMSSTYIDLLGNLGPQHFDKIYRSQPWVFTTVNKIAIAAAYLPFKSYGREPGGARDRLPFDHPLSRLLAHPYDYADVTSLVGAIVRDVGRYDNALVVKSYDFEGGPPTQLWPMDWSRVTVIPGEMTPVMGFEVTTYSGRKKLFRRDECIHFQLRGGVSPLEPLAQTLILEHAANTERISAYRNGMRPSAWIKAQQRLTDEQTMEVKRLLGAHQGVDNSGSVPVLPNTLEFNTIESESAKDAEWVAAKKLNREEIAAAYNIDPTQIGILDRATFANVNEAHRAFYMDTLRPWLGMIEEAFRVQLLEPEPAFEATFVEFDMADVLKGNLETRFEAYARAILSGWITRNEVRRLENLAPVDDRGADALSYPSNMVLLDGRIPSSGTVGQPGTASAAEALVRSLADEIRAEISASPNGGDSR